MRRTNMAIASVPRRQPDGLFFDRRALRLKSGSPLAGPAGPFFLSVAHQGVAQTLDACACTLHAPKDMRAPSYSPRVRICTRAWAQRIAYRLAFPNFPLEKYQKAVTSLGDTEGERAQKFRIGQDILRDALMEYWQGSCPLTGISAPELLRASAYDAFGPRPRRMDNGSTSTTVCFCLRYGMPRSTPAW